MEWIIKPITDNPLLVIILALVWLIKGIFNYKIGDAIERGNQKASRINKWFKGAGSFCWYWFLLLFPLIAIITLACLYPLQTLEFIIAVPSIPLFVITFCYAIFAWYMFSKAMENAPLLLGKRVAEELGTADFATDDELEENDLIGGNPKSNIYLGMTQ